MNTHIQHRDFTKRLVTIDDGIAKQERLAEQWAREAWEDSQLTPDEQSLLNWHLYICDASPLHCRVAPIRDVSEAEEIDPTKSNPEFGSAAWFAGIPEQEF